MLKLLKVLQLLTAVGLVGLGWLVYSDGSIAFATAASLCYVVAAVLAMLDVRIGIWVAFVCSLLTTAFAGYGVYRYVRNGFDFLTGQLASLGRAYLPPYLFLLVAVLGLVVVLLYLVQGRWLVGGRATR